MRFSVLLTCILIPLLIQPARSGATPPRQDFLPAGKELSDEKEENKKPGKHPPYNKRVFWTVAGVQVAGYSAALVGLNHAWYKDHPRTSLHFHNDMGDWKQMDKLGHMTTTYHLSRMGAESFRLSGMGRNRSAWLGSATGLGFMTVIEVLDGLSEEWGFSAADQVANMLGSAFFVGQEYLWQEQRLTWKFTFRKTELSGYRPEVLGSNLAENLIKDYNGMSFWASVNPSSFDPGWDWLPPWLNIAVGYGAYGMLGGSYNPAEHEGVPLPHYERYRRWLLSPDVDFTRIPTQHAFLKVLFKALNFIKLPAPALEFNNQQGLRFHLIHF